MGAESGASFNTAVRSWVLNSGFNSGNKEVIPSMIKVVMPTAKFQTKPEAFVWERPKLPPRDVLVECSSRYFEEVHFMYWLYSSEDFHTRVEATYSDAQLPRSNSWLCALHSIVALSASCIPSSDELGNEKLTRSSLETAKLLVSSVCDEADLDSVRALVLLVSSSLTCRVPDAKRLKLLVLVPSPPVQRIHKFRVFAYWHRYPHRVFARVTSGQVLGQ